MYSNEEYCDMILAYGEANKVSTVAQRIYARKYPRRTLPNHKTFRRLDQRLRDTGTFNGISRDRGRAIQRPPQRDERVLREIEWDPTTSIRRISARTQIAKTTVWKVLKNDNLKAYHFTPVQHLEEFDPQSRLQFCQMILRKHQEDRTFLKHLLFTDEATFTRDGVYNYHNAHTWSEVNPHAIRDDNFQRSFKVNVWCGMLGNILLGPYEMSYLDGETYLNFLQEDFEEMLDEHVPLLTRQNMTFMHDGAPAHYSTDVRNYLNLSYGQNWIGRGGPQPWPARSPDLTPMDFFLWGHLKDLVYERPVDSRDDLWQRIVQGCNKVRENSATIFPRVRENFVKRLRKCISENGDHFQHLL